MQDKIDEVKIRHNGERLSPDDAGLVKLRIIQSAIDVPLIGKRILPGTSLSSNPTEEQRSACATLLKGVNASSLTVISYHPGMGGCKRELKSASAGGAIVTLAGIENQRNISYIAVDGELLEQDKTSLSSEDELENVVPGSVLNVFHGKNSESTQSAVRWAVLNCHEYTHVDIIGALLEERVELLIVVSHNPATRLYWNYALADVHRLFCYVVIVNTAELGGSAVFAPFRRMGQDTNAKYGAGGQLFSSRGSAKFDAELNLDISLLRQLRMGFTEHGFAHVKSTDPTFEVEAMVPSQHFMATGDAVSVGSPGIASVVDYDFQWSGDSIRVAVAQLGHIGIDEYIESGYRLREAPVHDAFVSQLELWLEHLTGRLRCSHEGGAKLDLLVFPEVFVPRGFIPKLQEFSDNTGAIVVAGVDYPDTENANECVIIRPHQIDQIVYRKVTRSQYDGLLDSGTRMSMKRGNSLLRLVNSKGEGLGVLICYDYSHFDLLARLNREGRDSPLEMVVVVAHNPFGELYRSACIADAHRFYQYVVMCNVAEYGGSGVFGPVRTKGARQVLAEAGKGAETILLVDVDLAKLRAARSVANEQELLESDFQRRPGVLKRPLSCRRAPV